jgi:hypothetical protein
MLHNSDEIIIYVGGSQRKITYRVDASKRVTEEYIDDNCVIPIPKTADLNSVLIVQSISNQIKIIPYTLFGSPNFFRPDCKSIVSISKDGIVYEGELHDLDDNSASIITTEIVPGKSRRHNDELNIMKIRNYDTIKRSIPTDTNVDSRYHYLLVKPLTQDPFTINYIMDGCSWRGYYSILIELGNFVEESNENNPEEDPLEMKISLLRFFGMISNTTGTIINTKETFLVAGDIPMSRGKNSPKINFESRMISSQKVQTQNVEESSLDEYEKYAVPITHLEEETPSEIFTIYDIPVNKIYTNILGQSDVTYGYCFQTNKFLPDGDAMIYSSEDPIGSLLGESHISEVRIGDYINLHLGKTSTVRIDTILEQQDITDTYPQNNQDKNSTNNQNNQIDPKEIARIIRLSGRIQSVVIRSEIKNRNNHAVDIILKWPIGNGKVLSETCDKYERKNGNLEFMYLINPSETFSFKCKMVIATL